MIRLATFHTGYFKDSRSLKRPQYLIVMTIYETLKTVAYVIVKIHEGT